MKPKRVTQVIVTAAVTLIVGLLLLNFSAAEKKITQHVEHRYDVADPQFPRSMSVLLGPPLVADNRVDTLLNGDEIFPAMLAAIRAAKSTITFETYIYWSGEIGRAFADALAERAQAGVKVLVLLDAVGSNKLDRDSIELMRKAGAEIEFYHPVRWYTLGRLNNRTHRKLLVVDGRIGFTGGVGIADKWSGHGQDEDHWRDTHYRIEGPAVAQMQAAFMDNWTKVTGRVLHTQDYFPAVTGAGKHRAQVFHSSIEGGAESMHLMYLLSIAAASKTIHLAMAYFAPDPIALDTLVMALRRGVKVQILLPGPITDAQFVQNASRGQWGAVLEAGGEIYQYQPTMYHCKVLIVDGLWTSVGSTNFDTRSFRLNDEANLNVYDADLAQRQIDDFNADLKQARRVTLEEWRARPWRQKAWDWFAGLFGAQL
jgi:cardiolipin synthase A/B